MTTAELNRAKVYIGNINPGSVGSGFADSLAQLAAADLAMGWGCYVGKIAHQSSANVSLSRNKVVADFLTTDGEWLLFLDSDMVFPPDTHVRLLSAAQASGAKVIGGLCVMVDPEGVVPTLYLPHHEGVTRVQLDYEDDTITQVYATGAACLMVHRDVLDAIQAARPDESYPWFAEQQIKGRWVSEDLVFCFRAGDVGFKIYVDCTLPIGHQKYGRIWTAADIRSNVSMTKRPVVVVIPTRQRADLCAELVEQMIEQGEATEIIVIDNGIDPTAELLAAENPALTVLDGADLGVNAMWNLGIEHAIDNHGRAAHIAVLNDDLRIGPGFLGALSRALESDSKLAAVSGNYDGRAGPGLVEEVHDICAGRMDGAGGFAGFAFMIKASWFTGGYRFPAQCKWWYGDNDLVMAVAEVGGKVGIALGAQVEHIDGGSQSAGDVEWSAYREQTEKDRAAFEERWRAVFDARDRLAEQIEQARQQQADYDQLRAAARQAVA